VLASTASPVGLPVLAPVTSSAAVPVLAPSPSQLQFSLRAPPTPIIPPNLTPTVFPIVPSPTIGSTAGTRPSDYPVQFEHDYDNTGPVIHDGFVPVSASNENDRMVDQMIAGLPEEWCRPRDSFSSCDSEEESSMDSGGDSPLPDDEYDEDYEDAAEEQMLRVIDEANDRDEDEDFSVSDDDEHTLSDELIDDDGDDEEDEDRHVTNRRLTTRTAYARRDMLPPDESVKKIRGPRHQPDPGPQFRLLQENANQAFVRRKFQDALEYANKAIKMNPGIFATHNLLSEIYLAMGDEEKSVEALLIGAPTKKDKELWFHILGQIRLLDEKKYPKYTRKHKIELAQNCLNAILAIDPSDYEARREKLQIELELRHKHKAISAYSKMLLVRPYETEVLRDMAKLGTSTPMMVRMHLSRILRTFDLCIEWFLTNDSPLASNWDWSILNFYLELLERTKDYAKALKQVRLLARWVQGRQSESFWDSFDDDREWDIQDEPRRTAVPEFVLSRFSKERYGDGLPLEIRAKMGIYRIHVEPPNLAEAMVSSPPLSQ